MRSTALPSLTTHLQHPRLARERGRRWMLVSSEVRGLCGGGVGMRPVAGDGLEDDVEFVCEPKFIYFRAICRS
jgi:hypothetical protein